MEKMLLTVTEAADLVGLGRSKLYQLVQHGEIPVVRIGRAVRIQPGVLRSWVTAQADGLVPRVGLTRDEAVEARDHA